MLNRLQLFLSGAVLAALPTVVLAQVNTAEVEPNGSKGAATSVVRPMEAGDTFSGDFGGGGGADYFLVQTAAMPLGIYRHRLTPSSGNPDVNGLTIRGLLQSEGVPIAGSDGVAFATTDLAPSDVYIQWYGFGRGERLYVSVAGEGTYTFVHTVEPVTPVDAGDLPDFKPLTITTSLSPGDVGRLGHVLYGPAMELVTSDPSATIAPGVYHLALGVSQPAQMVLPLCSERVPSFPLDSATSGQALDFADAVAGNYSPAPETGCQLSSDAGFGRVYFLPRSAPYDVTWLRLVVPTSCNEGWTGVAPPPRRQFAMAHDPVRQRTVLFGGFQSSTPLADTWEFDGSTWRRRYVDGPVTPVGGVMAFDAARSKLVYYGGGVSNGLSAVVAAITGTWSFDGISWSRIAAANQPGRRIGHAMAFDAAREQVVLFGNNAGNGGASDNVTWTWDGTVWSPTAIEGPSPRGQTAMAYDAARGVVVLFGGSDSTGDFGDTWTWNGTSWTLAATTGPLARHGHTLTYDPLRQRVVLIGANSTLDAAVWEWDGSAWASSDDSAGALRFDHQTVFDEEHSGITVHGGTKIGSPDLPVADSETWIRTGTSWSMADATPGARIAAGVAYDPLRERIVLYGGYRWVNATEFNPPFGVDLTVTAMSDTWLWDGTRWTKSSAVGPGPRHNSQMEFDSARGVCVLFGGRTPGLPLARDTWIFNGTTWTRRATSGPPGRIQHAMAFDHVNQRMLLFGGDRSGPLGDTWTWNGTTWTQRLVAGPPARESHCMAADPLTRRIVLFGGNGEDNVLLDDTWEWDGTQWIFAGNGPGTYLDASLTFDSVSEKVVLAAGSFEPAFGGPVAFASNLWTWHGLSGGWQRRAHDLPIAASGNAMEFDGARGEIVLTGGSSNNSRGYYGATYVLPVTPTQITQQPQSAFVPLSRRATFTVAGNFAPDAMYQWRRNGVVLVDGSRISGAGTATLAIELVESTDAGAFDVVITDRCSSVISEPATLTVRCLGDFNLDGLLDPDDLSDFITCFFLDVQFPGACQEADFNVDGFRDPDDLSDFITAFFLTVQLGC